MLIVFHGRNALQFCVQWLHYIGNKLTYSQMSIIYPISVYWIFQVIRGVPWFFTTWLSSYIPHIIFSLLYIFWCCFVSSDCCLVTRLCLTLLRPHGLEPARLLCPWDFPGKNTGVGCHFLLTVSCIGRQIFYHWATREAQIMFNGKSFWWIVVILNGEGNCNPLQYSCLENPTDKGAWWLQSMGSERVRHDWVTKQQQLAWNCLI